MAKFKLTENHEQEGKVNCTIVVSFGEHEYTQEVLLPKANLKKAAQEYADQYQKDVEAAEASEA